MNISNSWSQILNSIKLIHSEHIFIYNLLYPFTPIWQVVYQLSSLTIAYNNLVSNYHLLTLLVWMSANYIPPPYHTVVFIFKSSPFITNFILLEMSLVFFLSLSLFSILIAYVLSNTMRVACYRTTFGYLFINSFFGTLKCSRAIPAVCNAL